MENHTAENQTIPDEVFIGRERETSDFMDSLDAILGKKPSLLQSVFPFLKKKIIAAERPKPRLFLYYGEGGFGKSHMLQKCLEIAASRRFKTILLDWDEYYARRSSLPNTSGKMITALFTVLTEPEHGIARFFDEYLRIEKKLEDIADMVERAWKDDASGLIKPLVKLGSTATGLPIPDFAQDFAANTLNELAKGSRRMIIDYLRDSQKMKREDLDLYENTEKALTEALVNGLAAASQLHPIALAIDTYEQVDRGADVDDWMRNVFLDLVIKKAPKVCVVLAGRNNHFQEYRNRLPDWSLYNRNFDDILLTDDEIRAFAQKYEVSLVGEEALLIRAGTAGIPLVVKDVLRLIGEGKDKKQVLKDLDNHAGTVESIIADMVDRFLKYTEEGEWKADRLRCYQMVMLRQFDPDLLREAWGLTPTEFAETMKVLTSRHSFFIPRTHQIHEKVKHFLQKYLISQYRQQTAERPQLQELAEQLLKAANNKLTTLETALPGIEQRYADNRYVGALFDMLLCRIWADGSQLKAIIPGYLIELLAFAPEIAKGFALELEELAPLFPTSQTAVIKTIYQGIHTFEPLTFESATRVPLEPERKFFEYLEKELKGSSEYRCALLDYLYGAHLVRQKDYDKVFERLQKAVPVLRSELNEQLGEVYIQLGYALPETQSDKVVLAYLLSIELEPDRAAYNNLGNALQKQGKLEEAIESYRKAIEIQPDYIYAHNGLGNVLREQGKFGEAIEAYRKAIEIQPDFVYAYNGFGYVLNKQGKLEEAIKACREAIEIQPDNADTWSNLGWIYLSMNELSEAETALQKSWELSGHNHSHALMNLGHIQLLQGEKEQAIAVYGNSIILYKNYKNKEEFFKDMQSDYTDLQMEVHGITPESYEAILQQLKDEAGIVPEA